MTSNNINARNLVVSFCKNADPTRPVSLQLPALFVPTLWGEGVVPRNSKRGRIASFFHKTTSFSDREKKVRTFFAKSLATLHKTKTLKEIGFRGIVVELYKELKDEKPIRELKGGSPLEDAPYLDDLASFSLAAAAAKEAAREKEVFDHSLLRSSELKEDEHLGIDAFKEMFCDGDEIDPSKLMHFAAFLRKNPGDASPDLDNRLQLLANAQEMRKNLQADFFAPQKPLTPEVRMQKMRAWAAKLASNVHALDPKKPFMFAGSYGQKKVDLKKVHGFLKMLPQQAVDKMPSEIKQFLATDNMPDPMDYATTYMNSQFDHLAGAHIKELGENPLVKLLFSNDERHLPGALKTLLPNFIGSKIEGSMQKGLLECIRPMLGMLLRDDSRKLPEFLSSLLPSGLEEGVQAGVMDNVLALTKKVYASEISELLNSIIMNLNAFTGSEGHDFELIGMLFQIASFSPSPETVSCLKWAVENVHSLGDPTNRAQIRKNLEAFVQSYAAIPLNATTAGIDSGIGSVFNGLRNILPPEMLELLGIDHFLSYGQFWFEFEKQENGNYTVLVYSSGQMMDQHPQASTTNDIQWPLRIKEISAEKLNTEFFYRLLSAHIDPQFDPKLNVKCEDLFSGIMEHLEGQAENDSNLTWRSKDSGDYSDRHLAELMLVEPSVSNSYILFKMRFQGLIDFCKPYLNAKNQKLQISDDKVCALLETASRIIQEGYPTYKDKIDDEMGTQILATLEEINQSIAAHRLTCQQALEDNPLDSIPSHDLGPAFDSIKSTLQAAGIGKKYIQSYKPVLAWALGDEIEELVDAFSDAIGDLPEANLSAATKLKNLVKAIVPATVTLTEDRGWLKNFFSSVYYQTAMAALRLSLSAAMMFRGGIPVFFLLSAANQGLQLIVPPMIYEWFTQVLGVVLRKSLEITFRVMAHCLMNPKDIESLYASINKNRKAAQTIAKKLLGKHEISYQLKKPIGIAQKNPLKLTFEDVRQKSKWSNFIPSNRGLSLSVSDKDQPINPPLPKLRGEMDPANFQKTLSHCLKLDPNTSIDDKLIYLTKVIKQLPVPQQGNDPFWGAIENSDQTFTLLHQTSKALYETFAAYQEKNDGELSSEMYGECVVLFHTVLAGMDYLSKKRPELQLEDYTLNYFDLVKWLMDNGSVISDPLCQKKLSDIVAYFNIDLENLPKNPATWVKKAAHSLFFYHFDTSMMGGLFEREKSIFTFNGTEQKYLQSFSEKNPGLITKIMDVSLTEEKLVKALAQLGAPGSGYLINTLIYHLRRQNLDRNPNLLFSEGSFANPEINVRALKQVKAGIEKLPRNEEENISSTLDLENVFIRRICECLNDPQYKTKYPEFAAIVESVYVKSDLSENDRVHILLQESREGMARKNPVLSPSYTHLRAQTVLTSSLIRFGIKKTYALNKTVPPVHAKKTIPISSFFGSYNQKEQWRSEEDDRLAEGCSASQFHPLSSANCRFRELPARTQSQVITEGIKPQKEQEASLNNWQIFLKAFGHEGIDLALLESIFTEASDSIIRALGYLRTHKNHLTHAVEMPNLLEYMMFKAGSLEKQIKECPEIVQTLAEFLTEQFAYYLERKEPRICFWLIYFGIKLKRSCAVYSPHSQHLFPDFQKQLAKLKDTSFATQGGKHFYHMLSALIADRPPEEYSRAQKTEIALSLLLTRLNESKEMTTDFTATLFKKDMTSAIHWPAMLKAMELEHQEKYLEWLPTVKSLLEQSESRHYLISNILLASDIVPQDTTEAIRKPKAVLFPSLVTKGFVQEKFKRSIQTGVIAATTPLTPALAFKNGHFTIDPFAGLIQLSEHTGVKQTDLLKHVQDISKECLMSNSNIQTVGPNTFATSDGQIQISTQVITSRWHQSVTMKATRMIDGVKYTFSRCPQIKRWLPHCHSHLDHFWVEDTGDLRKRIVVGSLDAHYTVTKLKADEDLYILETAIVVKKLVEVNPNTVGDEIAPFSRFCPLSEIKCYAYEGEQNLHKIEFAPYGISFEIVKENGVFKAVNNEMFPGYSISTRQAHKNLQAFPAYLLLENAEGQQKLILPCETLLANGAARVLSTISPLATTAFSFVNAHRIKSGEYFVYDVNPQADKSWTLSAENPGALAFAVVLYLIQGDEKAALKACSEFEALCAHSPIPETVHAHLLPLMLCPMNINGANGIRQRIVSAIEANRLTQIDPSKIKVKDNTLYDVAAAAMMIKDLYLLASLPENERAVNQHQEWFIFKAFFHHTHRIFKAQSKDLLPESTHNLMKRFGWNNVVENMGLTPILYRRFQLLKRKFGDKDSLLVEGLRFARKVATTESHMPSLLPLGISQQITDQTPELIVTFSEQSYVSPMPGSDNAETAKPKIQHRINLQPAYKKSLFSVARDALLNKCMNIKQLNLEELAVNREQAPYERQADTTEMSAEKFKRNFLCYCLIAKDGQGTENWNKIKAMLPLIRGGWDAQTQILVKYLETIMNNPRLFWSSADFHKAFQEADNLPILASDKKHPLKVRFPHLTPFFEHLNDRTITISSIPKVVSTGVGVIVTMAVQSIAIALSPQAKAIPAALHTVNTALQWMGSFYHAVQDEIAQRALAAASNAKKSIETQQNIYAILNVEEKLIEAKLGEDIYSMAFAEAALPADDFRVSSFTSGDNNPACAPTFDRVNQSVNDYYARPDRQVKGIQLKSNEGLWESYVTLSNMRDRLHAQLVTEQKKLMSLFDPGVTFDRVRIAFLSGNFHSICAKKGLNVDQLQQLELAVARDIVRNTRLQQMNRTVGYYEELARINPETTGDLFEAKLEQIADELKAKRAYNLDDVNTRLVRRLMLFELTTNKIIWKKQYEGVSKLLLGSDDNAVIELLMSLGKTYFCIPVIDAFEANGEQLVFNIFPAAVAETNIRQISRQIREIFHQNSYVFRFSRIVPLKPKNLDAYHLIQQRALENGEVINSTKEDIQALELIFIDQMNEYFTKKRKGLAVDSASILKLNKLLQMIRLKGKAIGDEAHVLFDEKQELNYPLGESSTIKQDYYFVMEACMRHMTQLPNIMQLILSNDLTKLKPEQYETEVMIPLAKKMAKYGRFSIESKARRKEFAKYVCGKTDNIPKWIQSSPLFSSMAMVKGVVTTLLPSILDKTINVDFGASHKGTEENARPYEGNTSPQEQSSIRNPYEGCIKTFIQFLHQGLSDRQSLALVTFLRSKAEKESKIQGVAINDTAVYKRFSSWLPSDSDQTLMSDEVHSQLARHNEAILCYIRFFVKKQIKYWTKNIRSGPQDFASMFASASFDTGTPYNFGTYPANLKMLWDSGTIGEALHIMSKKCPADGVHVLEASNPSLILQEALNKFFKEASDNFTALIDGSAQLKGLSNEYVAKEMLAFATRERGDIRGIVYFAKDKEGRDQLVCLEKGSTKPIPLDRCSIPPENRLTYFDQRHGFAADVKQKENGKGLDLVGSKITLQRLMQEVFRMRGLKKWKKLVGLSTESDKANEMNSTQTIHFALTKETQQLMSGDKESTLVDIIQLAIKNEALAAAESNYIAYPQKVQSVIRRAILDKLQQASNVGVMMKIFEEFYGVLTQRVEDDPAKLFGSIEVMESPLGEGGILEQIRTQAFALIKDSSTFSDAEKEQLKTTLDAISIETMPEEVKVFTDGKSTQINALGDLNKEVNTEVSTETETETETQAETEISLQTQNNDQFSWTSFKEATWEGKFNPHEIDWMKMTSPDSWGLTSTIDRLKALAHMGEDKPLIPDLFAVQDLLKSATQPHLRALSGEFDKRIWMTNNFLPTVVGILENTVEIGSRLQRQLFELLIHVKQNAHGDYKIVSVGCLSQKDAVALRERLKTVDPESDVKAFIYDVPNRSVVAGAEIDIAKLRKNRDLLLIESQLKLLNGDVDFHKDQIGPLVSWAKASGHAPVSEAASSLYQARGRAQTFFGTDLERALLCASGVPEEELL